MKLTIWAAVALLFAATANASGTRTLDGQVITNGANTMTIPAATDTFTGKATTDTLTNKSLSGSSNTFTNIPANTALSSQVPVANGGTGDATLTTNGILFGNGTSAVGITSAGSQYQCYQAGASGVPTVDAVHLDQSAATSGTLPVNRGGTGAATLTSNNVLLGNGTSAVQFVAPGTSGNLLTSNGTTWSSTAPSSVTPSINGGSGSPQSVVAATGITLSSIGYSNYVWVVGAVTAITVTATPSITACTADGQSLTIIGTSDTNTVTLQDTASLAGSKLRLNGNWVGAKYSVLELVCDITATEWDEVARR